MFWVYENWTHDKAIVHRADCSSCNDGRGIHADAGDRNGRWHGPFNVQREAGAFARNTGRLDVRGCKNCLPEYKEVK